MRAHRRSSLGFPLPVEVFMDFFEAFVGDVRVNLGSGDRRVTEHSLNGPNIRSIDEKISGEAVA